MRSRFTRAHHKERMGDNKETGKESRCPMNGGEQEARKTNTEMEDCIKRLRKGGTRMEKKINS